MKIKQKITLLTALLCAVSASAEVIRIYDSFVDTFSHGFTYIPQPVGFGTDFGVGITPSTPMEGHSAGLRIWSYNSTRRSDATVGLTSPATGGIRVSYKVVNRNYYFVESGLRKISLRAGNSGTEETLNSASASYQNLIEMISDGTVSGAWNRINETGSGAGRYVADVGGGVPAEELPEGFTSGTHTYDLIINASMTEDFTYVLHGVSRTLKPNRMELFINGIMVSPPENDGGAVFENKASFDPTLGFGVFSFTTATASHAETDFVFDQIYIYTGADVSSGEVIEQSVIEIVLAESNSLGGELYDNDLLGVFWSNGSSEWIYSTDGWKQLVGADASGYWAYHMGLEAWIYLPGDAPGHAYVYGQGWFHWTTEGTVAL